MEKDPLTDSEAKLFAALQSLKEEVDTQVLQNAQQLNNESYTLAMIQRIVALQFVQKHGLPADPATLQRIAAQLLQEYLRDYRGGNVA